MTYNNCKVNGCRFSEDHITERHCCGTCKFNGHGQTECGNEILIKELKKYKDDFIYNWCEIENCKDPNTHTTNGHSCLYCDKRLTDTHLKLCPNNSKTTKGNSICDDIEYYNIALKDYVDDVKMNKGEYKVSSGGMGCTWLIRNNSVNGNNEYLFIHSDNWGQYGDNTSFLPRYKAFIYGYKLVE